MRKNKAFVAAEVSATFAFCAICAYIGGQLAQDHADGSSKANESTKDCARLVGADRDPTRRVSGDRTRCGPPVSTPLRPGRRTLARRKENNEQLTVAESDRVLRLERIAGHADRVFGSHEKAQRWLRSEIIALNGARPIDLLASETGAHVVSEELIRIDYGMFA
jgi:hypothetical protein